MLLFTMESPLGSLRVVELAPRELEILQLAALGYTWTAIARRLGLSRWTVDTYRRRTYAKFGVATKVEALVAAHRVGALDITALVA